MKIISPSAEIIEDELEKLTLPERIEKCGRDLPIFHTFEETEEPDGLLVELFVPTVPDGTDPAHHRVAAQREKRLGLGVFVERVFVAVERVPHIQLQRRNPIGIAAIDAPRKIDKPLELATRVGRDDADGFGADGHRALNRSLAGG